MYIKELLKDTLQAQFVKEWNSEMDFRKCTLYKLLKAEFKLEQYLLKLSHDVFWYIVKFRCSNHKWAIKTGRYSGIDRNLRYYCVIKMLWKMSITLFLNVLNQILWLYINSALQSPSMFKFIQLLKSSDDVKIGKRISMFTKKCKIA